MPGKKIYKINLHYAIKLFTFYILLRQTYKFIFAFRDIFINFPYFSESLFSPKAKKMWKTNMKLYSIRLSRLKLFIWDSLLQTTKQEKRTTNHPITRIIQYKYHSYKIISKFSKCNMHLGICNNLSQKSPCTLPNTMI